VLGLMLDGTEADLAALHRLSSFVVEQYDAGLSLRQIAELTNRSFCRPADLGQSGRPPSTTECGCPTHGARTDRPELSPPRRVFRRGERALYRASTAPVPGIPAARTAPRGLILVSSPIQLSWVLRGVQPDGDRWWSPAA